MKTIVSVSGGLSSFETLRRVVEQRGKQNVIALFADVKGDGATHFWSAVPAVERLLHERYGGEARSLYRFLWQMSHALDVPIIRLEHEDRKTVFTHMAERRAFLVINGRWRVAPCSKYGKRERIARWIKEHIEPGSANMALGFDWTELARLKNAQYYWQKRLGWEIEIIAPLAQPPYADNLAIQSIARAMGIEPSSSYRQGFKHDNCNGGCVEAGIRHFVLLYRERREVYWYWMYQEEQLQRYWGKGVTILKQQRNGETRGLSLRELEQQILHGVAPLPDSKDACACFAMSFMSDIPVTGMPKKPTDKSSGGEHSTDTTLRQSVLFDEVTQAVEK